jgi:DNA-binding PadR family transcriptional regulator
MSAIPLSVEWSLLGLLRQRPRHGYALHQELSDSQGLGLVWTLKQSQLYALLEKLEARGYITPTLDTENYPPRKIYHLTDAGRAALDAWLREPVEHGRDLRLEFLAKLYFAQLEGPTVTRALLQQQRAACQTWLRQQQQALEDLPEAQTYETLVREFRMGQIDAMLTWLDRCEESLIETEEMS